MKKLTLLEKINKINKAYFSLADLEKISGLKRASLKVALVRLIKAEKIIRLGRGLYAIGADKLPLENLAVNFYRPSYISFESALNYYNILSQQASALTLATSGRKKEVNFAGQTAVYRHLRPDLFWGYRKENDFLIAEPEKAFLDLVYLSLNGYANFDPLEMNLGFLNKNILQKYLKKFNNRRLEKLVKKLIK